MRTFFFDSHAFYEIMEGNTEYESYKKNVAIITTRLNLMELQYGLLLKYGKEIANNYFEELKMFAIEISDTVFKEANEFRASLKARKLSYVDCIGYILAQRHNVKFLTGDKQFEDLPNVEYVK